jgi:titin
MRKTILALLSILIVALCGLPAQAAHGASGPAEPTSIPVFDWHELNNGCAATAVICNAADPESVSTTQLTSELAYLVAQGYHSVTAAQYLAWVSGQSPVLPAKPVYLVDDNGIYNLLAGAQPILAADGFTMSVSVVTGFADGAGGACPNPTYEPGCPVANQNWDATWAQLSKLSSSVYDFIFESGSAGHFVQTYDPNCSQFYACVVPGETAGAYESRVSSEISAGQSEETSKLGSRYTPGLWVVPYSDDAYTACPESFCTPQNSTGPAGWLPGWTAANFPVAFVEDSFRNGVQNERFRIDVQGWMTEAEFESTLNADLAAGDFTLSHTPLPAPVVSGAVTDPTIVLGQSESDTFTVTGTGSVTPEGSVTFSVCGPVSAPAPCSTGTQLGTAVTLSGSGNSASATSASFTPSVAGSYCITGSYSGDNSYAPGGDSTTTDGCFGVSTTPSAPVMGTPGRANGQVTLTWAPPSDSGGSPLLGYHVYRGTASGGEAAVPIATTTASTYTDTSLSDGTTYYYTVSAFNSVGDSAVSNEVAATPATTPSQPVITGASAGPGRATLTWSAPASNGGSAISGYTITPYIGAVAQSPLNVGNVLAYTVGSLVNGTTYSFTVTANNAVGAGAASVRSGLVTPVTTPGQPAIVSLIAGNAQATLTWSAPVSNGGSAISGYTITPYIGAVAQSPLNVGNVLAYTVGSLVNGTTYSFTVTANNAVGAGAASNPSGSGTPRAATTAVLTYGSGGGLTQFGQSAGWSDTLSSTQAGSITGTVTFSAGGIVLCAAVPVVAKVANCATTTLPVGSYTSATANPVIATFSSSNPVFAGAVSNALGQQVLADGTTVSISSGLGGTSVYGQAVPVVAHASAGFGSLPIGSSVNFSLDGNPEAGCIAVAVVAGVANCTYTGLSTSAAGVAHSFGATLVPGNANFAGSSSGGLADTAFNQTPTLTLTSNATPDYSPATPLWRAALATSYSPAAGPTGTVTFYDGSSVVCTNVAVVAGSATCSPSLAPGVHGDVTAVYSGDGNYNQVTCAPISQTVIPAVPAGLSAGVAAYPALGVTVSWASSPGATGYQLYRVGNPVPIYTGSATEYTDTSATAASTSYAYTVAAGITAGYSGVSGAASVVTPALPGQPTSLVATAGNQQVALTWVAPVGVVNGYDVYQDGVLIDTVAGSSATIGSLTNGTTYSFTVAGFNDGGVGALSAAVPAGPTTVPGAPTGVSASAGIGSVMLTWSAPASAGGSPVTGYVVTPYSGGSALSPVTTSAVNVTVGQLTGGVAYTFTVQAVNSTGLGLPSAASGSVTPAPAPVPSPGGVISTANCTSLAAAGSCSVADAGTTAQGSGEGSLTLSEYTTNPPVPTDFPTTGSDFYVQVAPGSSFAAVALRSCNQPSGAVLEWCQPAEHWRIRLHRSGPDGGYGARAESAGRRFVHDQGPFASQARGVLRAGGRWRDLLVQRTVCRLDGWGTPQLTGRRDRR